MNCAIYIRVSTEKQREKFSLPSQLKILTEYAKFKAWDYIIYDEGAGSGETLENRPQMLKLLDDARENKFNVCLVIELERLSRDEDLFDWLTIKKVFRDNGIKIATPNQTYDLTDDEDDFLSDLFGALAQRETKKLVREKVKLPDEKGEYNIEYYLEKQILPAVDNILQVFKIDIKSIIDGKKQTTLGDF